MPEEEEEIVLKPEDIYPELKDPKKPVETKVQVEVVTEKEEGKKEEPSTQLIELRTRLANRERTIQTLRETVISLEKKVVRLSKKLNEPVTLTSRGGQELSDTPEGEMTAAHALIRLRERGEI